MDRNIDWIKILRYLNNECSREEEQELVAWINSDPENEEFILFLEMIWQMEPNEKKIVDADLAWERFDNKYFMDEKGSVHETPDSAASRSIVHFSRNKKRYGWLSGVVLAASILIAVIFSLQFTTDATQGVHEMTVDEIEYRELRTEKGQRTRIILTDGSVIHLNGDSYLKIPEMFRGDEDRKVYLEGEAFFEVSSDRNIKFQVVANETVTTVLGTRFNVRSYLEEKDVTVVVADGRVALGYLNESEIEPAILTKNNKGVIGSGNRPLITEIDDLSVYSGWTEGELIFEQEPLPKMISKLERWFGIDIEIYDEAGGLLNKQITASFSERQSAEDVLQSISLVLGLSIERTDTSSNAYKLINKQQ